MAETIGIQVPTEAYGRTQRTNIEETGLDHRACFDLEKLVGISRPRAKDILDHDGRLKPDGTSY